MNWPIASLSSSGAVFFGAAGTSTIVLYWGSGTTLAALSEPRRFTSRRTIRLTWFDWDGWVFFVLLLRCGHNWSRRGLEDESLEFHWSRDVADYFADRRRRRRNPLSYRRSDRWYRANSRWSDWQARRSYRWLRNVGARLLLCSGRRGRRQRTRSRRKGRRQCWQIRDVGTWWSGSRREDGRLNRCWTRCNYLLRSFTITLCGGGSCGWWW